MITNFVHNINHFFRFEKAATQTSDAERIILRKYVATSQKITEIGVFEGLNTRDFALCSPENAIVYAIDPFFNGRLGFCQGEIIAKREWKRNKIFGKIKIIKGLSWDVAHLLPNFLDLIFIDGDHSFEGVKRDFEIYSEKLNKNGIIAFHDARIFSGGWTKKDWGPVRLIQEIIMHDANWKIIEEVDSLVLIARSYN